MLALVVVHARARSLLVLLATVGLGDAIGGCKSRVDAQPPVTTGAASASALASAGPLPEQGPVYDRAARSLDAVDLADLGRAFGGARLLALVDHPASRSVALAALPFAPDAEVAFAGLALRAKAASGADASALLEAIVASLEQRGRRGEWLAAEPIEQSLPTLLEVAKDASRTEEERGLAATALHRLRERGFRGAEEPPPIE